METELAAPKSKLPARHPGGRPRKWTPWLVRRLCTCVARGMPYSQACLAAGVSKSFFFERKAGDPVFAAQLERARARGLDRLLRRILKASETDWRAASWLCEHTAPEHFARTRIELEAFGQVEHFVSQETLNQIAEARARIEREKLSGNGSAPLALPERKPEEGKA